MAETSFAACYTSRPFWAGSKVDFTVPRVDGWFDNQMAEEVYVQETEAYTLKVCRDGRILLRLSQLERDDPCETSPSLDVLVQRWGTYLDYLNIFYLLLDSATVEIDHLYYFIFHELTRRDAFRVPYENGRSPYEPRASESIVSALQDERYLRSYPPNSLIEFAPLIVMRSCVRSVDAIAHAGALFDRVLACPESVKPLAGFAKSLSAYKVGHYETALVLSWFIIEASLSHLWASHLNSLNYEMADGRKRIHSKRRELLTGRDLPISVVSNMLELFALLDHGLFGDIDTVRGYRNKIVHARDLTLGGGEVELSIKTALAMIKRLWGFELTFNPMYQVHNI